MPPSAVVAAACPTERKQLSFSIWTDFENFSKFAPGPRHSEAAVVVFDQLESWTQAMKTVRG